MKPLNDLQTLEDFQDALDQAQLALDGCRHTLPRNRGKVWRVTREGSQYYMNGSHYTKAELRSLISIRREDLVNPNMEEISYAGYTGPELRALLDRLDRSVAEGLISREEWRR